MSDQDAYQRILVSLSDAMLDDTHWPATSALIDEACGITGNCLAVGEVPKDDIRALTVGLYVRGQRHEEEKREDFEVYHPIDECVPRVRRLSDSRLVHVTDQYTAKLKRGVWGARFQGDTRTLPTDLERLTIAVETRSGECRNATEASSVPRTSSWSMSGPSATHGWCAATGRSRSTDGDYSPLEIDST